MKPGERVAVGVLLALTFGLGFVAMVKAGVTPAGMIAIVVGLFILLGLAIQPVWIINGMDRTAEPSKPIPQHEVQKNGTVIAKMSDGSTREFHNWKAFWTFSQRAPHVAPTSSKRDPRWSNLRS